MFKIRYFYLSLVLYYLLILVLAVGIELFFVKYAVYEVKTSIQESAERSLRQTQHIDDFLAFREDDAYNIYMPTSVAGHYEVTNVFEALWGMPVTGETQLEQIYKQLYNNEEFRQVLKLSKPITQPLRYYDIPLSYNSPTFPRMSWYTIPRALTIGSNFVSNLGNTEDLFVLKSLEGKGTERAKLDELLKNYGLEETVRKTTEKTYFNTPLNTGLTYVNRELLSSLFINNMDITMRSKYIGMDNLTNAATCSQGGADRGITHIGTITCGVAYNNLIVGEDRLSRFNPISSGTFTLLRYDEIDQYTSGTLYEGIKPTIEYKLVDMHNSANDNLLRMLFGANTDSGSMGSSKADYLKQINMLKFQNYDSVVANEYNYYPFIVAKVTFEADVIIPYVTPTLRGLAGRNSLGNSLGNFLDIWTNDATLVNDNGVRRFKHTVFFAVAP